MEEINWVELCKKCKNWCCKNENPFASKKELSILKFDKITTKKDNTCFFLNSSGKCSEYMKRPFECRIFPFDILKIDGKLMWVLWKNCPGAEALDPKKSVAELEKELLKKYDFEYIQEYVKFHEKNQPEKYSDKEYEIVKELIFKLSCK
jgi:hypothetical protein